MKILKIEIRCKTRERARMKCKIFYYFSPFIREIGWVYFFLPNELGVKRLY